MHARTHHHYALALVLALATGCASGPAVRNGAATVPSRSLRGERFNVVGRVDGQGDAYDATALFERGNAHVRARRCDLAIVEYDRLIREFPEARIAPSARFNRGVCLQSQGQHDPAFASFRDAARSTTENDLVRDAWFRAAVSGESGGHPESVIEATGALLERPALRVVDRVEALARRASAYMAQGDRARAADTAQQAIALAPTTETVHALEDDTYIAQARFILGEVTRLNAADVAIRVEDDDLEQKIERRVQLVTRAHVLFNDAIRVGNPHWAAASGFSLGEMYRSLYESIVQAPTPADWDERAVGIYRRRTGERLRPLLQGALRAWEATQTMAQRNGIADNAWVRRTDEQIDALRELVLQSARTPTSSR